MRDRLIEIIKKTVVPYFAEFIADDLIADGWMRKPYKIGQTVYVLRSQTSNGKNLYLREERIDHYRVFDTRVFMLFDSGRMSVPDYLWETRVFLTKEEAEAKSKGGD